MRPSRRKLYALSVRSETGSRQLVSWSWGRRSAWAGGRALSWSLAEDCVRLPGKFRFPKKVTPQACPCFLLPSSAWNTDIMGRGATLKPHAWAPKPTHHPMLMMAEKKCRKTLGLPWHCWTADCPQSPPPSSWAKQFVFSIVWATGSPACCYSQERALLTKIYL